MMRRCIVPLLVTLLCFLHSSVRAEDWIGKDFQAYDFTMQPWIDSNCKPTDLQGIQGISYMNPGQSMPRVVLFCRKDNAPGVQYKVSYAQLNSPTINITSAGSVKILSWSGPTLIEHNGSPFTYFIVYIEKIH